MRKRMILAGVLALAMTADANAGWRSRSRTVTTMTTASGPVAAVAGKLAQWKAEFQAARGLRAVHVGGGFGGDTHEGCGFSTVSADDAVRRCCYFGQLPIREVGVARGVAGWHATVIYGSRITCSGAGCGK